MTRRLLVVSVAVAAALVVPMACGPVCGVGTVLINNVCTVAPPASVDASVPGVDASVPALDASVTPEPTGSCRPLLDDACHGPIALHCRSVADGGLSGGAYSNEDCSVFDAGCATSTNGVYCTGGLYDQPCTRTTCASHTVRLDCAASGTQPVVCGEGNACFVTTGGADCLPDSTIACTTATYASRCDSTATAISYCASNGFVSLDRCNIEPHPSNVCALNLASKPVCIAPGAASCDPAVTAPRCASQSELVVCDEFSDHEVVAPCSHGQMCVGADGGASCR